MRLYDLLPSAFRQIDQTNGDASGKGTLENVVDTLQDVYAPVLADAKNLPNLTDIDAVDIKYLPMIAQLLGVSFLSSESTWSDKKKREFTKSLVALWKINGQRRAWRALLNVHGRPSYFPWELWKTRLYEIDDYSLFQDYTHRIKAARVDVRRVTDGDKHPAINNAVRRMLDIARPIHVLIRWPVTKANATDDFLFAYDTAQYSLGSEVESVQSETARMPVDRGVTFTKILVGWAKTALSETTDEHHAKRHQVGGGDTINVTGLPGLLADPQTPAAHDHDTIYINKANTVPYTPTTDYHPATKKYVDDNGGAGAHYEEVFTATTTKVVTHSLGFEPQVTVLDSSGELIEVTVVHDTINQLTLTFNGTLTNAKVICDSCG